MSHKAIPCLRPCTSCHYLHTRVYLLPLALVLYQHRGVWVYLLPPSCKRYQHTKSTVYLLPLATCLDTSRTEQSLSRSPRITKQQTPASSATRLSQTQCNRWPAVYSLMSTRNPNPPHASLCYSSVLKRDFAITDYADNGAKTGEGIVVDTSADYAFVGGNA